MRTGWTASRTSVLEVRALERLSDLLGQLATSGAAISDLSWELDAANEAHDRGAQPAPVRMPAVEPSGTPPALGIKLGGIVWVAEPGLRIGGDNFPAGVALAAAPRAMAAAPGPSIDVTPEEITLTAGVEVGFAIATG